MADVFINGDGADAVGYDVATGGVLDIFDMSTDVCLDSGVLKDTIAGLVISQLDRVPEETEHPVVNYKNLRIKVLKVEENAIAKVLIHINPIAEPDEDGKDEGDKGDE